MGLWLIEKQKQPIKLENVVEKHKQQKIAKHLVDKYKLEIETRRAEEARQTAGRQAQQAEEARQVTARQEQRWAILNAQRAAARIPVQPITPVIIPQSRGPRYANPFAPSS
jgi:hypothetical protein